MRYEVTVYAGEEYWYSYFRQDDSDWENDLPAEEYERS